MGREKLWILKPDGTEKEIGEIEGCYLYEVEYGSPRPKTSYIQMEGSDGNIDMGTTFDTRPIIARFLIESNDYNDYYLLQREVWQMIYDRNAYYIRHSVMPGFRWLVHPKECDPSRVDLNTATFELEFEAFKGYSESADSSLSPMTFDSELWQAGQGLIADNVQYTHTTNRFKIYNPGDFTVDPREHYLNISIDCSSNNLRIANVTTGDQFICYRSTMKGDLLEIDGVYPKYKDLHIGRETNNGLITLVPGWNEIEISGASLIEISFDFHALYH
ncbi:phage tail family protein [Terribacillus sp. 7520-G]|uniref:phage tail family protein n=1 Tax=Terribacillus sp. 7520-G TaxID=2025389 RepID=UPI000BA73E70|nr:phage tail family protein [Terribacillus sp. 7520-G]PAD39821.1 hypothetical protein CHH53_04055 [Terribacillus sp. 7520-G]